LCHSEAVMLGTGQFCLFKIYSISKEIA
jgi:hypothetical protein